MSALEDLKKLDLKSLDLKKVTALLLSKNELLAQVVVAGLSFVVLVSFINAYLIQGHDYRQQAQQLNAKIDLVQTYNSKLKQLKKFLEGMPEALDEDRLSLQVADLAAQNRINILTFAPGQVRTDAFSQALSIHMTVRAAAYKDLVMFLKAVESAPFALRVDSCSIGMNNSMTAEGVQNRAIDAQLEISSVSLRK